MLFVHELVKNYTIHTEQKGELETRGMITLQYVEDIMITLEPRND